MYNPFMTVEIERNSPYQSVKRRIAEFRQIEERRGNSTIIHAKPETLMLNKELEENDLIKRVTFVQVNSEDEVNVFEVNFTNLSSKDLSTFRKDEINKARLVTGEGERIIWRETLPGDYAPLKPGQTLAPKQMTFNLR